MSTPTNQFQQSPYLREQRQFPQDDVKSFSQQVDLAYIDIARNMNQRTIGTHALNYPLVTGEKFFLAGSSQPQQVLRQVYTFTSAGSIPHGINTNTVSYFSLCYGSYYDSADNSYGVIFASSVPIAGQVTFYITPTNIVVINSGAPAIVSGIIVLNWISQY